MLRKFTMMMIEQIFSTLDPILKSHRVRDFDLYHERQVTRAYNVKDKTLEAAREAVEVGVALRIFLEGRFSFVYSTDLSEKGLQDLVEAATRLVKFMEPDEDYRMASSEGMLSSTDLKNRDPRLESIPSSEKIGVALAMERAAKAFDPRVRWVRSASYEEESTTKSLMNSRGLRVSHSQTLCSLGLMAVAESGSDAESAFEFNFSPYFSELDPEKTGQAAARRAVSYLGSITPPTRRVPVVLDPLVAAEILGVLVFSFQGNEVFKERSFLKEKLGQKVYSDQLTIVDDGLLTGGTASCPFDGEGQPHRRIPLLEQGVLKNFLLDSYFAVKLGMPTNASSGRKGIKQMPAIHPSNLWIEPGMLSDEDIFREIGEGVWVTEVIGMHMANAITGEFSVGVQGFLIEGGEVTQPIKKVAIAGNLHEMMAQVVRTGLRSRFYFNMGAPTLAIREMAIGGS